jgi:predicted amidohydrolase
MKDFKIAVAQWPVAAAKDLNLDRAAAFLRRAAEEGAALGVLPEMFSTPYDLAAMRAGAEDGDGPTLRRIRSAAREYRIHVVAGSFPQRRGDRCFNISYLVDPGGEVLGSHAKVHLFDVDLDTVKVKESEVFAAGERPLVVDLPFCRLGVAICYDLRFPEVFRFFEDQGVEVVALPAAFSRTTGRAHWHVLLRARAVDHQAFVAAACPAPVEGSGYVAYGHSLIADPWGDILAEAGEGEEMVTARLSAEKLEKVRRELPVLKHRRPDLYRRWGR